MMLNKRKMQEQTQMLDVLVQEWYITISEYMCITEVIAKYICEQLA